MSGLTANNFTGEINSGGLGLTAAPTPANGVSNFTMAAGTGAITADLANDICGSTTTTTVTMRPSTNNAGATQMTFTWALTPGTGASAVCAKEVAKWR